MDSTTVRVDGAVQAAKEAKESVTQVEAKIEAERKCRELWQTGMEERFAAVEFKDSTEEIKPADPEIQKKLKDIETKHAGMKSTTLGRFGRIGDRRTGGRSTGEELLGRQSRRWAGKGKGNGTPKSSSSGVVR